MLSRLPDTGIKPSHLRNQQVTRITEVTLGADCCGTGVQCSALHPVIAAALQPCKMHYTSMHYTS
jgi:hypothetical protein